MELRQWLGVRDIGVAGDVIYLLDSHRKLNSLVKNTSLMQRILSVSDKSNAAYFESYSWGDVEYPITSYMQHVTENDDFWNMTVIPVPAPGRPARRYYSVTKGDYIPASRAKSFDFCDEEAIAPGHFTRPALINFEGEHLPPMFISHAVKLDSIPAMAKCGGMLWPSHAITWRVPASFGEVVFLLNMDALVYNTRPLGSPSDNVLITATDSWSPDTRDLERTAKAITHEMRGDYDWWSGNLSPDEGGYGTRSVQSKLLYGDRDPDSLIGGWAPDSAWNIVKSMGQVQDRFRHLVDVHSVDGDPYVWNTREWRTENLPRDDWYPYLELKIANLVGINAYVACFYPRRNQRLVNRALDDLGYEGWRVPVRWGGKTRDNADDPERVRWAETMTAAILEWSENPCALDVPETLNSPYNGDELPSSYYPYSPIRTWWLRGNSHHWGSRTGYCYRRSDE